MDIHLHGIYPDALQNNVIVRLYTSVSNTNNISDIIYDALRSKRVLYNI